MPSTLFLQSDIKNPYSIYETMLNSHPIFWDEANQIWAIYSHKHCIEILNSPHVHIPVSNQNNEQQLNKYALKIVNHLSRLSNGIQHEIAKESAILLFSNMKLVDTTAIIAKLVSDDLIDNKIDWVSSVCKKFPLLIVLKSFGFEQNDCNFILEKMEQLVKIMIPNKTTEQIKSINEISEHLFLITEKQLSNLNFYQSLLNKISEPHTISLKETSTLCVSNLIGLFIQSYDAGRGLLSNSLLQITNTINLISKNNINKNLIQKSVIETLRFDPPIHNTRRVAIAPITLGKTTIKKNDTILLVLAAANRDFEKFDNPMNFDTERVNNNENITFGIGGHMCLAKHFSIQITTEVLFYLFENYKTISILEDNIQYEPMINARLPKSIWISIQ
ncbi:cytochrome P450 [Flavobacterium sp. F-65]|uniref:Cytochrome P450 n=1 Tax=Flavobacterium pisciphilum TaxID=2893755 RepID=A0ABS8MS77_9FLAO|nr:cytochrome P450 [Flavobacterium sp. F-65]MCC9071626.1 cytochrome P450 [Flavobacterium sp. F-65]